MPLDVPGRTRATMTGINGLPGRFSAKHVPEFRKAFRDVAAPPGSSDLGNPASPCRGRDSGLQLFSFNQEFLVGACHQRAPTTSLPFVHTARRSYRLGAEVRPSDGPGMPRHTGAES